MALHAVAWSMLGLLAIFVMSRSHSAIASWVEPVQAEIPGWIGVGLGLSDKEPLTAYHVVVEPDLLRAARLMRPAAESLADDWWFPVQVGVDGAVHSASAQLLHAGSAREGLRLRFDGRNRPSGIHKLELEPSQPERHVRELVAREAAIEAGLLAVPSGFAQLTINGGAPQPVLWREGNSAAMLQRLGLAVGEVFRSAPERRGRVDERLPQHYVATLSERPSPAQATAMRRLIELVRSNDDTRFNDAISTVVDVDQVLAWNALALALEATTSSHAQAAASPDWYFDPVSGLLRPLVRSLERAEVLGATASVVPNDAGRLVERLLASAEWRSLRDAQIRQWVGVTRSARLEQIDRQLGTLAARLAANGALASRASLLSELADVRRSTREALHERANALREQLALGSITPTARLTDVAHHAASADGSIDAWVAESGLPLVVRGDALVLPAGSHRIERTLLIPHSHRLVIEPGAHIRMAPNVSVLTFRRLEAIGSRQAPIDIRGLDPSRPWGTIGVARAPEPSELAYVTVSGGSNAMLEGIEFTGQLAFNYSDVVIRDCDVRDGHGDDSLSVRRGYFQVARSRFIDNASDGFDAEWSTGTIEQSLFANNRDDGLDLATSEVRVHRGWFRRMGDKAISAGERSQVSVSDSSLVDSQIAIASKEDSRVDVEGSEFRRNEIGISLYRDNRIFGSGFGTVNGGLFAENLRDFAVETGSGLTLNGVERLDSSAAGLVIGLRANLDAPSLLQ